jgi:hypothetical protein
MDKSRDYLTKLRDMDQFMATANAFAHHKSQNGNGVFMCTLQSHVTPGTYQCTLLYTEKMSQTTLTTIPGMINLRFMSCINNVTTGFGMGLDFDECRTHYETIKTVVNFDDYGDRMVFLTDLESYCTLYLNNTPMFKFMVQYV